MVSNRSVLKTSTIVFTVRVFSWKKIPIIYLRVQKLRFQKFFDSVSYKLKVQKLVLSFHCPGTICCVSNLFTEMTEFKKWFLIYKIKSMVTLLLIKNVIRFSCTASNGQNGVILNSDLTMENSEDFIRWRRLYMILVYSFFEIFHTFWLSLRTF